MLLSTRDYYAALNAKNADSVTIFPQLGLGDQIIILGAILELAKKKKVTVLTTEAGFKFLSVVLRRSDVQLEVIPKIWLSAPLWHHSRRYARRIALQENSKLIFLGQDLIGWMCRFRPDINIAEQMYRLLNVEPHRYVSPEVKEHLLSIEIEQMPIPRQPYAIVDSFEEERRHIPDFFIENIENRGITVIHNPREISYLKLINLVVNAAEIHVVNSSLLCLSLLLPTKAKLKRVYLINNDLFSGHRLYDLSWQEVSILDNRNKTIQDFIAIDRKDHLKLCIKKSRRLDRRIFDALFKNFSGGSLVRSFTQYPKD